jgi:predicted aldo/keto reductase-like oxidoreductase
MLCFQKQLIGERRMHQMKYRQFGSTGLKVSVISMGCEGFIGKKPAQVKNDIDYLFAQGVNFIDMYSPDPDFRKNLGSAIAGRREEIIIEGHLCSVWQNGEYMRSRNIKLVKQAFESMLTELGADYVDVGMIHYVDSLNDWKKVSEGPVMKYAEQMKAEGKIKHIGLSSHNPKVAAAAVKTGKIEVLLFAINPCYDMQPAGEDVEQLWADENYAHELKNQDEERKALYELCESRGVGIDVMKVYGGGDLLDDKLSPFGKAFTPVQCIHYALTRPAVSAVMLGCKTKKEWDAAIAYCSAAAKEKDYAPVLSGLDRFKFEKHCMYCGHCGPCTAGIDIAAVMKFLNLTIAQGVVPETVRDHYDLLKHHASECIECGRCMRNCPFDVEIIENMKKAAEVFGK